MLIRGPIPTPIDTPKQEILIRPWQNTENTYISTTNSTIIVAGFVEVSPTLDNDEMLIIGFKPTPAR
jgi:hypothetical protein